MNQVRLRCDPFAGSLGYGAGQRKVCSICGFTLGLALSPGVPNILNICFDMGARPRLCHPVLDAARISLHPHPTPYSSYVSHPPLRVVRRRPRSLRTYFRSYHS